MYKFSNLLCMKVANWVWKRVESEGKVNEKSVNFEKDIERQP